MLGIDYTQYHVKKSVRTSKGKVKVIEVSPITESEQTQDSQQELPPFPSDTILPPPYEGTQYPK